MDIAPLGFESDGAAEEEICSIDGGGGAEHSASSNSFFVDIISPLGSFIINVVRAALFPNFLSVMVEGHERRIIFHLHN